MKVVVFIFLYNLFFILYNEYISCIKLIIERRAYGVFNLDGYRDRPDGGRTRCTGRYFRAHRLFVLIIVFFNHFEKTWIGKLFTLGQRSTTKAGYVSNDVLEDLAGKEGVAHTTLRPAGIAKIDGNLVDVVTEGDFIDAGSPIVVLRVVGGRNIVRKCD